MSKLKNDDTIAAIATPPGEGGVSIIRLSGPEAFVVLRQVFRMHQQKQWKPRTLFFGKVVAKDGHILDEALAVYFPSPHSYTGEDVAELHLHGGWTLTRRILDEVMKQGARQADPGEFTRRAFLNGKMDLAQAEAVLELIHSRSEKALRIAADHLSGSLSKVLQKLRQDILLIYAHLEGSLDFPDEHLETEDVQSLIERTQKIIDELTRLYSSFQRTSVLREGVRVVIVGKPNAGKSSLFNALLERDQALVSEFPGTTRDSIEDVIQIEGFLIRLIDTAGLSSTLQHPLDTLSMNQTREVMKKADLFLMVADGETALDEEDETIVVAIDHSKPIVWVMNKSDKGKKQFPIEIKGRKVNAWISVSAKEKTGMDELIRNLSKEISCFSSVETGEQITRLRHRDLLEKAIKFLQHSVQALESKQPFEIAVLDLKQALESIREMIGEVYSEDLLDVIFSEFCIGK